MRFSVTFSFLFSMVLPASSQGLMEFGDLRAGAAGTGAGAGLSASMGHQGAVKRSFEKLTKNMTPAQKAAYAAQSKVINKYWTSGCQYEMAKQWSNAEKTFAYVLQVITLRDGSKSSTRLPVLQKLVAATKAQKKLDTAINYQKSIVEWQKSASRPDERMVAKTQQDLTGLYLDKHDYKSAEPVLKDSVLLYAKYPTLPAQQKIVTLKTYSIVLRKLKRNAEADKIDKELNPRAANGKPTVDAPASPTDVGQAVKTDEPSSAETSLPLPVSEPKTTETLTTETKTPESQPETITTEPQTSESKMPAPAISEDATPVAIPAEPDKPTGLQAPAADAGETKQVNDAVIPAAK